MTSANANKPHPILVVSNLANNPLLMHHAAAQSRRTGARVILVHVIPPGVTGKRIAPDEPVTFADPLLCRAVREELEFLALQLLWQGIVCDPVVLSGEPARQIVALTHARAADRVLLAAREPAFGSPSGEWTLVQLLLSQLDVPLFVIGPRASSLPERDASDGRILLPLSLHHDRSDCVKFGTDLARETSSRLALLHVANTPGMTEHERQQAHNSARTQLAALAAAATDPRVPIEIVVREGDVAQSIVEEGICPHRDFIVMGTGALHDDGVSPKRILSKVIANARCPVAALKCLERAEPDMNELQVAVTGVAH